LEMVSQYQTDGVPRVAPHSALAERQKRWHNLTEQARRFRHVLINQREACGFRRHEDADRHSPIPDFPDRVPGTNTEECL
jgi:hypothetical protein